MLYTISKKKILISALLATICSFSWVAEDFAALIAAKLLAYRNARPVEKAFLHTDKPYYTTGDTLWFQAYLAEGALHLADSASNLLYVDLIEHKNGKNAALKRVQMQAGSGNGEIVLADSIPPGSYTLRAYTNWMRNFSDDYFFQKNIYVFGPGEPPAAPARSGNVDLQFFPEGGQLVEGIGTRVAFKAVNASGMGEDVSGYILNQNQDTVASFQAAHLGMGRFPFEPKPDQQYRAFYRVKDGPSTACDFPKINKDGFVMVVDNVSNPGRMRIIAYAHIPGKTGIPVNIVAHSRGIVAFVIKGKITEKGLTTAIPTSELPDGITHLTLFNDEQRPVCERLIFVNHEKNLKVDVKPSRTSYKPREKAEVEITVVDSSGKPIETNLSLSATDGNQIQNQPFEDNIVSYFLLSSDLKGFVEQPGYYFDKTNSIRKVHVDYLMMTQGWTRFRWEDILRDSIPEPKYYVEQGITLEGEVKRNNKRPSEKVMVSVFLSNDSLSTMTSTESDADGRFKLYNLVFTDSLKVRLQGMNKRGNQLLSFSVTPYVVPKVTLFKPPYYPVTVDAQQLSEYLRRAAQDQEIARKIRESRERLLQEVTIKAKKQVQRDSRKIYGTADATIKVTPQLAAGRFSVLDILAGRVAGVQVVGSGMNASVYIRGNRGEPQFVLDGVPVEKDFITNMNVNDVESIDVLKGAGAAIFGSRGGNGVISILTKRGNADYDYTSEVIPGVMNTVISGFNVPKQFYSPVYEASAPVSGNPDYRSTIFWAPRLKTDKNGKVKVSYYQSDAATIVHLEVQAMSANGLSGHGKATYSVN